MKIKEIVPGEVLSAIGHGIAKGKQFYDRSIKTTPAFEKFSGKFGQPVILHAFTEYAICTTLSQISGVKYSEQTNGRNFPFLDIEIQKRFKLNVCRVRKPSHVPRFAKYRAQYSMSNQFILFPDLYPERSIELLPYLIVTHGIYQNMSTDNVFGGIGIPDAFSPKNWIDYELLNDYLVADMIVPEELIETQENVVVRLSKSIANEG
jgi:hypothetical protein